jgi:hypothetical protein
MPTAPSARRAAASKILKQSLADLLTAKMRERLLRCNYENCSNQFRDEMFDCRPLITRRHSVVRARMCERVLAGE